MFKKSETTNYGSNIKTAGILSFSIHGINLTEKEFKKVTNNDRKLTYDVKKIKNTDYCPLILTLKHPINNYFVEVPIYYSTIPVEYQGKNRYINQHGEVSNYCTPEEFKNLDKSFFTHGENIKDYRILTDGVEAICKLVIKSGDFNKNFWETKSENLEFSFYDLVDDLLNNGNKATLIKTWFTPEKDQTFSIKLLQALYIDKNQITREEVYIPLFNPHKFIFTFFQKTYEAAKNELSRNEKNDYFKSRNYRFWFDEIMKSADDLYLQEEKSSSKSIETDDDLPF